MAATTPLKIPPSRQCNDNSTIPAGGQVSRVLHFSHGCAFRVALGNPRLRV